MTSSHLILLAAAGDAAGTPPVWASTIMPFALMAVVFWFFIFRPQMQQQKAHKNKLAAIKKGDSVVTGGGLIGKVLKLDENYVDLELGTNVKVKALRSTIADVVSPTGTAAND